MNIIKILKTYKKYFIFILNKIKYIYQIKKIINKNNDINSECPICIYLKSKVINFNFKNQKIKKYFCLNCNHIYSNYLENDLKKIQKTFNYKKETYKKKYQKNVMIKLLKFKKIQNGKYLDFGTGGNISIIYELKKEFSQHDFYACDLNKRKDKNYFITYSKNKYINFFNGISSYAVIEHLSKTFYSWKYFNKLLKKTTECNTFMIHAFPSQIQYDLSHWGTKVLKHSSIFSKKSLNIICEYTGFKFIKWEFSKISGWPLFYFQKIRDL